MDELFGGIDGKLRTLSITDSTMMRIVHSAMNKAHERVKSKEGVIERLNEISKFYELAVMQLEGCMEFVQDESSHEEEVLAGLLEIRNRLTGRLIETEHAITEKDRELVERAESETRLRRALELKERELNSLKAKLETTRNSNKGEFRQLKNTVDQQVWNIRQRLEPDYNGRLRCGGQGSEIGDEKVEQMGTDIDALKETLDVAFKKMSSAVFSSEVVPIEQQWRWGVEKDTFFVLIKGLMWDLQEMFEGKDWKSQEKRFPNGFIEIWHDLVDEVEELKSELSCFLGQNEEIAQEICGGSLQDKPITEEINYDENETYVTKIMSTEAGELICLRQEDMSEKVHLSIRRENKPVSLKKRAQDVIVKLDNLMGWNHKLHELLGDHSHAYRKDIIFDTSLEAREIVNKVSCTIIQEKPNMVYLNLETMIIEETYAVLFEGLLEELNFKLYRCDVESRIWEGMCIDSLIEMKNRWDENIGNNIIESQIREEIYCLILDEVIKDFGFSHDLNMVKSNNTRDENANSEDIETPTCTEIVKDWNKIIEDINTDILVREEISHIVFDEAFKTIIDHTSFALRQCEEVKLAEAEEHDKASLIKDDIFQLLDDQGNRLGSMLYDENLETCKHESLIQNVETSKATLGKMSFSLGIEFGDPLKIHDQEKPKICFVKDTESSSGNYDLNELKQIDQLNSIQTSILRFLEEMMDFELMIGEKLENHSLRLDEIHQYHLNPLVNIVTSLREQESLYRKAFVRRCQNLHKAEIEVDLLGDQVEVLLNLLQNIHTSLQKYSSISQQNIWVSELLHMIKKKLKGVMHTPNQLLRDQ